MQGHGPTQHKWDHTKGSCCDQLQHEAFHHMIYSFGMQLFWYPHFTKHRWHVTLLSMVTGQIHHLTVHQMFVCLLSCSLVTTYNSTPDLHIPILPCTQDLHKTQFSVSISKLFATCDSHCWHFYTAILPNIVLTTTQDKENCSALLQLTIATSLLLSNNALPWHTAGNCSQFMQYSFYHYFMQYHH